MRNKVLLAALLVTSCTNTMEATKAGAKQDLTKIRAQVADKIYPEGKFMTPAVTTYEYTYCYKSWADVSCYRQPVQGQEYILMDNQ